MYDSAKLPITRASCFLTALCIVRIKARSEGVCGTESVQSFTMRCGASPGSVGSGIDSAYHLRNEASGLKSTLSSMDDNIP